MEKTKGNNKEEDLEKSLAENDYIEIGNYHPNQVLFKIFISNYTIQAIL